MFSFTRTYFESYVTYSLSKPFRKKKKKNFQELLLNYALYPVTSKEYVKSLMTNPLYFTITFYLIYIYIFCLLFLRDESPMKANFLQNMVEDRTESALSYYEFLLHIQQQVNKWTNEDIWLKVMIMQNTWECVILSFSIRFVD